MMENASGLETNIRIITKERNILCFNMKKGKTKATVALLIDFLAIHGLNILATDVNSGLVYESHRESHNNKLTCGSRLKRL